jgi:uncharacterized protein YuzB (UPF0349 family)
MKYYFCKAATGPQRTAAAGACILATDHGKGESDMKIRFCENNKGSGKVYKRLKENYPGANIKRKECLKQCSTCRKAPLALADGEPVQAEDGDELYRKLAERLENG